MSTPLSHLEILICAALQRQPLPPEDRDIDDIVISIREEYQRILTSIHDEDNLDAYVPARQHQLVRLIDLMVASSPLQGMDVMYRHIYESLLELLQFLERDFAAYMDEDCKIPFPYLLMIQCQISEDMNRLMFKFDCYQIDDELQELIAAPFHQLLSVEDQVFCYSYYNIVYLKRLMDELIRLPYEDWNELLLTFNFNDPDYVKYLIVSIKSEVTDMPDVRLKWELLFMWQKILDQAPVYPGMHYKPLNKSLRKQVQAWIANELSLLEKYEGIDAQGADMRQWKDYKVDTGLTVPQFGRFIGLLLEKKIILNENKTELALFFAVFFTSFQNDHITPGSLRNSFYDKRSEIAKSLDAILEELQELNKKEI